MQYAGQKRKADGLDDDSGFGITEDQREIFRQHREERLAKRQKTTESKQTTDSKQTTVVGGLGHQLLSRAGYTGTGGLGRLGQGLVTPIETGGLIQGSTVQARAGLGSETKLEFKSHVYQEPTIQIDIPVDWLPSASTDLKDVKWSSVIRWQAGDQSLDQSVTLAPIAEELNKAKSQLDKLTDKALLLARNRANPYERVDREKFINRAAIKLAEIDCALDFQLVAKAPCAVLDVGDLCGGPGGFSEYILFRRKWQARIWGMTLAGGREDFQPHRFRSDAPINHFRSVNGRTRTGDLYDPGNRMDYIRTVAQATKGLGLHLVVGDGGFDVSGRESRQEELSARLISCQMTIALAVLRPGGSLVLKLFDCFLPVTKDLICIASIAFERVALVKPVQSRPANSERYLVCTGYKERNFPLCSALNASCSAMTQMTPAGTLLAGAPSDFIKSLSNVLSAIDKSNHQIATAQLAALQRLQCYVEDPTLRSNDQEAVREACLRRWCLDNEPAIGSGLAPGELAPFGRQLYSYDGDQQWTELGLSIVTKAARSLKSSATVPEDAKQIALWPMMVGGQRGLLIRDRQAVIVLGASGDLTPAWIKGAAMPDTILDVWIPAFGTTLFVLDAWFLPCSTVEKSSVYLKSVTERAPLVQAFVEVLDDSKRLVYTPPMVGNSTEWTRKPSVLLDTVGRSTTTGQWFLNEKTEWAPVS